jgi:flagella basal body P-ring formation protein FlgA
LCGHTRTVSAAYARVRIRQIGVDPDRLLIGGADLVTVSQPAQPFPASAVEKAAREAIEAANPGAQAQISSLSQGLSLPTGAVSLQPGSIRMAGSDSGTLPITVLVDGRETASVTVSFRLLRMAPVVVAVRDLPMGTVLTAEDVRLEQRPSTSGLVQLSDLASVVGQQAAAPIKAGIALFPSQLRPAILIRRGARVRLICKGPSFVATAAGEALQDGAAGETVRVRSLSSLREVVGLVVDEQTVEVPF